MKRDKHPWMTVLMLGVWFLVFEAGGQVGAAPKDRATLFEKPFPGLVPDIQTAKGIVSAACRPLFGAKEASKYELVGFRGKDDWVIYAMLKRKPGDEPMMEDPPEFHIVVEDGRITLGGPYSARPKSDQRQTTMQDPGNEDPPSVEWHDVDVREALRELFRGYGAKYKLDPAVRGKVTFTKKQALLEPTVKQLVALVQADYYVDKGVYVVFQPKQLTGPPKSPTIGQKPFPGFVPDAQTAGLIARAALSPLVGAKEAPKYGFSKAVLVGDSWIVRAGIPDEKVSPRDIAKLGPVHRSWPEFWIARKDGAIELRFD